MEEVPDREAESECAETHRDQNPKRESDSRRREDRHLGRRNRDRSHSRRTLAAHVRRWTRLSRRRGARRARLLELRVPRRHVNRDGLHRRRRRVRRALPSHAEATLLGRREVRCSLRRGLRGSLGRRAIRGLPRLGRRARRVRHALPEGCLRRLTLRRWRRIRLRESRPALR